MIGPQDATRVYKYQRAADKVCWGGRRRQWAEAGRTPRGCTSAHGVNTAAAKGITKRGPKDRCGEGKKRKGGGR